MADYAHRVTLPVDAPSGMRQAYRDQARREIGEQLFDLVVESTDGMVLSISKKTRRDMPNIYEQYPRPPQIETVYRIHAAHVQRVNVPHYAARMEPMAYVAPIPSPQIRYTSARAMIIELFKRSPFSARTGDELRKRARLEL